jgi:hypothetical protein
MSVFIATLGRNPIVVLQSLSFAINLIDPEDPLEAIWLIPEGPKTATESSTLKLIGKIHIMTGLTPIIFEYVSNSTQVAVQIETALVDPNYNLSKNPQLLCDFTGGGKDRSFSLAQLAFKKQWISFCLNPHDRISASTIMIKPENSGETFSRASYGLLPLTEILDINDVTVIPNRRGTASTFPLVEIDNKRYQIMKDQEKYFVFPLKPIRSRDKTEQYKIIQSHSRKIADLLAVPIYRARQRKDFLSDEIYDKYIKDLQREAKKSSGWVLLAGDTHEDAIQKYRASRTSAQPSCKPLPSISDKTKILITLLGDQTVPSYASVLLHIPDQVIILTTPEIEAKGVAGNLKNALSCSGVSKIDIWSCLDTSNPQSAFEVAQEISNLCENCSEIIVNVNGLTTALMVAICFGFSDNSKVNLEYLDPVSKEMYSFSGAKFTPIPWRKNSSEVENEKNFRIFLSLYGHSISGPLSKFPKPNSEMYRLDFYEMEIEWKKLEKEDPKLRKWENNGRAGEYQLYCDLIATLEKDGAIIYPESTVTASDESTFSPDALVLHQGKIVMFDAKNSLYEALQEEEAEAYSQARHSETLGGHYANGVIVALKTGNAPWSKTNPRTKAVFKALEYMISEPRHRVVISVRDPSEKPVGVKDFPACLKDIFPNCTPKKFA